MKKYVINAKTCNLPVVEMSTGKKKASSFIPYFDKEKLTLSYLALSIHNDGGEDMYIPFESLRFISSDLCTMVDTSNQNYMPETNKNIRLLDTSITAKAGNISLFTIGNVIQIDVEDDGTVCSVTLNNGQAYMIPREKNPEYAAVNDAFAAEAFNYKNDTLRMNAKLNEPEKKEPENNNNRVFLSNPMEREPMSSIIDKKDNQNRDFHKAEVVKEEKKAEPTVDAIDGAASVETENNEIHAPIVEQTKNKKEKAVKSKNSMMARLRRCIAPVIALLLFVVIYILLKKYLFN